jgi:hypothetical protein
MQLKTDGVGGERTERQPRPFDRAFPLLNPLLARAALEGDDVLGAPRYVGDDEADTRIKPAWMPVYLGDHSA